MNHIFEDDNKNCNVDTSKVMERNHMSLSSVKCLASKYSELNDACISNYKNTNQKENY